MMPDGLGQELQERPYHRIVRRRGGRDGPNGPFTIGAILSKDILPLQHLYQLGP